MNAFSKKWEYLNAAILPHFFDCNFVRIHQTMRVMLAMEAGLCKTFWTWEQFLVYSYENKEDA